ILREIGPRVDALRDQAAKWTDYESIRNDLRRRALRWYKASFGTTAEERATLAARIAGVDREIDRLADYVAEGESATAGSDEDLRAARAEEELRRIASADATGSEASMRERVAALEAGLIAIAGERERGTIATELERARDGAAETARLAEAAAERAGAARNDVQRLDGDLALLRGQTAALREAVARAEAELVSREAAREMPALPRGFSWLH